VVEIHVAPLQAHTRVVEEENKSTTARHFGNRLLEVYSKNRDERRDNKNNHGSRGVNKQQSWSFCKRSRSYLDGVTSYERERHLPILFSSYQAH
jgi:hypothetical protein